MNIFKESSTGKLLENVNIPFFVLNRFNVIEEANNSFLQIFEEITPSSE